MPTVAATGSTVKAFTSQSGHRSRSRREDAGQWVGGKGSGPGRGLSLTLTPRRLDAVGFVQPRISRAGHGRERLVSSGAAREAGGGASPRSERDADGGGYRFDGESVHESVRSPVPLST